MLNWLKKKARLSLPSRYVSILRRNNQADPMFLTEQSMFSQQQTPPERVRLSIFNLDGEQYDLEVPYLMSVDSVKMMAVGHFYQKPMDELASTTSNERTQNCTKDLKSNMYRLVSVRNSQTLQDERSISSEELIENEKLLLVKCHKNSNTNHSTLDYYSSVEYDNDTSWERIVAETCNMEPKNMDRQAEPLTPKVDFKIALRRILLTLIEASIRLIASDSNCIDTFINIFEQLEKRHRPRIDKSTLKQLTEMGFSEARATTALLLKRNVTEAMEWLLDESNCESTDLELESEFVSMNPQERKAFFVTDGGDPAKKVMQEFNKYISKWFQPDMKAVQNLQDLGYGSDVSQEALRTTYNNEAVAKALLEGNNTVALEMQIGYERDSPVMAAILESPIIQCALPKPKTLFALMVLCENPNNANIWLSDSETHPLVSQILRIYHAEKYRLTTKNDSLVTPTGSPSRLYNGGQRAPLPMQVTPPCSRARRRTETSLEPMSQSSSPIASRPTARSDDNAVPEVRTFTFMLPSTGEFATISVRLEHPSTASASVQVSSDDVEMSDDQPDMP